MSVLAVPLLNLHHARQHIGAFMDDTFPADCHFSRPKVHDRPRRGFDGLQIQTSMNSAHSRWVCRTDRRGPDPQPQGGRALLCPPQGQYDQFRPAGQGPPPDQLRQPDAALSRAAAEDRGRGSDQEGSDDARHRSDLTAGQGAAWPHRRSAAHR